MFKNVCSLAPLSSDACRIPSPDTSIPRPPSAGPLFSTQTQHFLTPSPPPLPSPKAPVHKKSGALLDTPQQEHMPTPHTSPHPAELSSDSPAVCYSVAENKTLSFLLPLACTVAVSE